MKYTTRMLLSPLLISVLLTSCGDDPAMVEKREKQKTEISRLKGELNLIEEKLKNIPGDVSEELTKARKDAEQQAEEIAKLEAEITALDTRKRTLQSDFDSYRAKYQAK
jgi:peptidoglycan hydrolase CwlO-like protein